MSFISYCTDAFLTVLMYLEILNFSTQPPSLIMHMTEPVKMLSQQKQRVVQTVLFVGIVPV